MFQCDVYGVPCYKNDYHRFDNVCRKELVTPVSADQIVNNSNFCTCVAIDIAKVADKEYDLSLNNYFVSLKGKIGLYQLWIDVGECQDHDLFSMLCVYVGKGVAETRVLKHIKDKWPENELIYVTFYECENRIAKYIEQLFLDTYNFHQNESENKGYESLFARWDEYRHTHGTELQVMANMLAKKDYYK